MTLIEANRQLKSGLDWAFLVGIVFALALGGKVVPFLIVVGIVPIPFLWRALRNRKLVVSPARLLVPAGVYFAYVLATFYLFTGLAPGEKLPVNPDLELYGVGIAMLLVGMVRSLQIDGLRRIFDVAVPWTLLAAFVVLTALLYLGYREDCRVQGGAAWPFIPALLFGTLTFLSLVGWRGFSKRQSNVRLLLNTLAIVVVVALTASRGIAVAQAGVLAILFVMSLIPRFRGAVPGWSQLLVSSVLGIVLAGLVSLSVGCGAVDRVMPLIKTIGILSDDGAGKAAPPPAASTPAQPSQETAPAAQEPASPEAGARPAPNLTQQIMDTDMSIGVRLAMWKTSWQAIRDAPIFGHGSLYLQHLITERYGFEHNHNQYLSWLVTGGVVQLAIGLLFLSIPWILSAGLPLADRMMMTLAVSVFWGISMMFDSYFNLKFYTHYYCLLLGLLYALVNDMVAGGRAKDGSFD